MVSTSLPTHRRVSRVAGALLALALAVTLQAGTAPPTASAAPPPAAPPSAAPPSADVAAPPTASAPRPPAPPVVPAGIEDLAAYVPANSCTPKARPGTVRLGRLLTTTYPGTTFGGSRACPATPNSEHHDGRAVDWMNSVRNAKQKKQAKAVIDWLFATDAQGNRYANARRLGVMYVIWDNHIWGAYRASDGWRTYNGCTAKSKQRTSLDAACHRNHMHLSLSWAGATGRTSYWSGTVAATDYGRCRPADLSWATGYKAPNPVPCPRAGRPKAPKGASKTLKTIVTYSGRGMSRGSSYGAVRAVQKAVGAEQTGTYSAATEKKVRSWQAAHHVKVTGKVGYATWRALKKALAP